MNPFRSEHVKNEEHLGAAPRIDTVRVPLDAVVITQELARRPSHLPNYEVESKALVALAQEMVNSPHHVLQKLVEFAMALCKAHSAGISLLETGEHHEVFRWNAATGRFASILGGCIPRDQSPCGVVIGRDSVMLFGYPERHYDYPMKVEPPIVEALLTPFHVGGKPVGTVWVIAHDESRKFDAEDARVLQDLSKFAASAYQMQHSLTLSKYSEKCFKALVEASSEVSYRVSPDWIEMHQLGGGGFLSDTATPSKGWMQEYIAAEDQPFLWAAIQRAIANKSVFELEHRVRRIDGTVGWTLSRAIPVLDEKGEITEWFGAAADVTARKLAEEAVLESKNRLSTIFDNLVEGIILVDENGELLDWNKQALLMHEVEDYLPFSAAVKQFELYHLDGTPVPLEQWPIFRLLRGEEWRDYEVVVKRKASKWERIFSYGGILVRDGASRVAMRLITARDVTDTKRAHKAIIQSEKLASVGRMAMTIAHEINNPLGAVTNSLFLVSSIPGLPDLARTHLDIADKELRRMAHITKQTLGFYRETVKPATFSLPASMDGTLDLYAPKVKNKSAKIERKYRGEGRVFGIEGELRQVISNLIANSLDALRNGGRLCLRTSTWNVKDCPMVRMTVADTGSGIRPEHLKEIFEPFFTTKETFGTGLGLWVTRELINRHEGRIRVRSLLGKGTVFSVWLPADRRSHDRDSTENAV
jgi:two-component system, cell cycle sensor histidine kinase and response regulator CckA